MKTLALGVLATLFSAVPSFAPRAATPAHFWSRSFGNDDTHDESVTSVAIIPTNGDIVVAGYFYGTIDFGTGTLTAAGTGGSADAFLACFDRSGRAKWGKAFGDPSTDQSDIGASVGVDAAGNIYFTGSFGWRIEFGGSELVSNGSSDVFLARFDRNGNHLWSHSYGSAGYESSQQLCVDAAGNVVIIGGFSSPIDFGGGNLNSHGGVDGFIVKFNSSGVWQLNTAIGGAGQDTGLGVAIDGTGNIYATGYFTGTVTVGALAPIVSAGGNDVWIVKLNSSGVPQWSRRGGGADTDLGVGISANASGVAVVGGFGGSPAAPPGTGNFGGSTFISAGDYDGFVAKYTSAGAHEWSYRFGGPIDDVGYAVFINSVSKVFVVGSSGADANGVPSTGDVDLLATKYAANGSIIWTDLMGGSHAERGNAVAVDAVDNIIAGGGFEIVTNLGGDNLQGGAGGAYIAKFGVAEPAISTIKDVANDQGRNVRITLTRSPMDDGTAQLPIAGYQAFRRILPLPAYAVAKGGTQAVPSGMWEHVASIPASNASTYRMIAPTLADSTIASGMYRTKFFVRAATDNPAVFFDSPVDSGYSVDNLAPGIPLNFAYDSGQLSWDESNAGDFDYFTVYGNSSNSLAGATVVDYTVTPAMDVTGSPYSYYFVTATDFSGNEGKAAVAAALTGAGETRSYVLSIANFPNPFNPRTTIRYTLPSRGPVTVSIYDASGARIATLVDHEDRAAGAYSLEWDGRSESGAPVSSGVYFARIEHAGGVKTKKMTLLK